MVWVHAWCLIVRPCKAQFIHFPFFKWHRIYCELVPHFSVVLGEKGQRADPNLAGVCVTVNMWRLVIKTLHISCCALRFVSSSRLMLDSLSLSLTFLIIHVVQHSNLYFFSSLICTFVLLSNLKWMYKWCMSFYGSTVKVNWFVTFCWPIQNAYKGVPFGWWESPLMLIYEVPTIRTYLYYWDNWKCKMDS